MGLPCETKHRSALIFSQIFLCINEDSSYSLHCVTNNYSSKQRDMQSTKPGWHELQLSAEKEIVHIVHALCSTTIDNTRLRNSMLVDWEM